jgi:hypothetical protein
MNRKDSRSTLMLATTIDVLCVFAVHAGPLDIWTWSDTLPTRNTLNSISFASVRPGQDGCGPIGGLISSATNG